MDVFPLHRLQDEREEQPLDCRKQREHFVASDLLVLAISDGENVEAKQIGLDDCS